MSHLHPYYWVVYHYFSTRAQRYTMSVLELFDDAEHRKGAGVGDLMIASVLGANSTEVRQCKLDPSLKASRFQTLIAKGITELFNLNLVF